MALLKPYYFGKIGTQSSNVVEILKAAQMVAASSSTVLIQGESGTGKEWMAKSIHDQSPRKEKPFIAIHAAALPESLLESELFGHEKGSFTGAQTQRIGRFEMAQDGTIFLDEISELSPALQTKLLRVIQERTFERIGGNKTIHLNVRLIVASNKSLLEMVRTNRFREDLYYRLSVITLNLLPLRDRKEDIPLLVSELIKKHQETNKQNYHPTSQFLDHLQKYDYPGNIRELANIVERAVVFCKNGVLDSMLIDFGPREIFKIEKPETFTLEGKTNWKALVDAYRQSKGNKLKAARMLGMPESTFRYQWKKGIKNISIGEKNATQSV